MNVSCFKLLSFRFDQNSLGQFGEYRITPDSQQNFNFHVWNENEAAKNAFKMNIKRKDAGKSSLENSGGNPKDKLLLLNTSKWAELPLKEKKNSTGHQELTTTKRGGKKNTRQTLSFTSKITQIKRACVQWGFTDTYGRDLPSLSSWPGL